MEVGLSPNQESQLNELAVTTGRGADDLVQEAITRLLARNKWFQQQVQAGIDDFACGRFIEEEEMAARVRGCCNFDASPLDARRRGRPAVDTRLFT